MDLQFHPTCMILHPKTSSGSDTFREINPAVGSFKIHGLPHVVEKKVIKQDDPTTSKTWKQFLIKAPAEENKLYWEH